MKLERLLRFSPLRIVGTGVEGSARENAHLPSDTPTPVPAFDSRTFVVVGYWPGKKVTKHAGMAVALELVRTWVASGATHVELSPEWSFRGDAA